jgi:hypothetical protein
MSVFHHFGLVISLKSPRFFPEVHSLWILWLTMHGQNALKNRPRKSIDETTARKPQADKIPETKAGLLTRSGFKAFPAAGASGMILKLSLPVDLDSG